MPYRNEKLAPEVRGKLRQFYRLIMSYGDFKQAKYIASYILDNKLHEADDQRLLEALNCAMIIAYCRPFSKNDRGIDTKIPALPETFLKGLSDDEKETHEVVFTDRNGLLAHTDSSAVQLDPEVWKTNNQKVLVPWQHDRFAPLTEEATKTFLSLSEKMFERVMSERTRLEPELIDCFKEIPIEQILNNDTKDTDNK
jgi:hypothetical protein